MSQDRTPEQSDILAEARWAVGWLVGLIEDDRVQDLYSDDEYVERAKKLLDRLNAEGQ